jgi:hypothetical protein
MVWCLLVVNYLSFFKSITNAANLGLEFGILADWHMQVTIYLCGSGILIYQLRTKEFTSIHEF